MVGNNLVKDLVNKDILSDKLKSEEGIDAFDFKKFDEEIEKSFQSFLESQKNQFTGEATKDTVETSFNGWLNKQYNSLDKMKDTEIDNKIVSGTAFELQSFKTLSELEIFQKQLQAEKDNTKTTETITLGESEIKINFYNGITSTQVVGEINGNNFEGKQDIIDLLKDGKIKELQQKIGGTKSGNNYDNLPKYGDDGKFGTETFDALKKYISDKKINGAISDTESPSGSTDGSGSNTDVIVNSDGSVTTVTETATYDSQYGEMIPVGVETYGKKNKFDCKLDESIKLVESNFPTDSKVEMIPQYNNNNVILKDGELKYNADFAGQDSFTVIVKNPDGTTLYQNNIIVNIEGNVLENDNIPQGVERQIDKILNEINSQTNFVEQKTYVENKIKEIRIDYKDIMKKLNESSIEEDERVLLTDRVVEIEKITKILIVKESEIHLKEYLNSNHDSLGKKLNDKCDYYFEGEYISKEKFMRKLDKGKINIEKIRFVDLNIDLTNYAGDEKSEITAYLEDVNGDKRNFDITNLILTDDPYLGIGKGLTKDQEIQYKSDIYVTKIEDKSEINREKQALKRILGIKGLFGLGGVDEDMSIATEDYNTNNPSIMERRNLRQLKNIIWDCYKDNDMTIQEKFRDVARNYDLSIPPRPSQNADKNSQKLYEMYKMYKEDQNCGDYFKKVMGLFENYFVRGIDNFDVATGKKGENDKSDIFTSMYKKEAIGRAEGLIDPDKKRQAIKSIFKEGYEGGIKFEGVSFTGSEELSHLKKLVKKIDLSTYLTDPNASKKHKEFAKLYDTYKASRINNTVDSKGKFVVKGEAKSNKGEDLYYNAVFDFLVGMVEGRQDVVSGVNSIRINNMLEGAKVEENEKNWYDSPEEKQFVMLLADFNKDGRVDTGDRGLIMGLTVKNMYKSAKVDQKYLEVAPEGETTTAPWQNVIDFAIGYMEQNGDVGLLADLERLKGKDLKEILKEMKTNPGLLNYLQNILANSPMPIDYIYKYGKNASAEYLNFVMPQIENGNFKIEGLEEKFQDEYRLLVEQGLVDDPKIRAILKPMFYAGVLQNGGVTYGAGGVGMALDAGKVGTFTMNLGYGDIPGIGPEGQTESVLGVVFSYGNSVELSKNTDLNYGAGLGATHKNLFVPMAYGSVGIKTRLNPKVNLDSLKAKSAHYFGVGANINFGLSPIGLIGGGVSMGWSREKMKLLNKQSVQIKESLTSKTGVLYKSLVGVDLTKDKENIISTIAQNLAQHFYGKAFNDLSDSDRSQLNIAASNLYRGISYYTTGLKDIGGKLQENDPRLAQIIHDVSESYVINWKNDAKKDASGRYVSGVGVSAQLLAGYVPIVSIVEFTNYKNIYSTETNQSHANYYERLVTGRGMDFVENKNFYDEKGRLNKYAVEYMNAKFSIAHPDVSVPDLNMKLMPNEDGSFAGDIKPALYIPKNLISYANINIDADVADYTTIREIDGVEYVVVPSNTKIAVMDYSRLNSAKFHLFIGDNKAKEDDTKVGYDMADFGGSPEAYKGETESIKVSLESVSTKINSINSDLEKSKYKDSNPFPIKNCTKIENGNATFEFKEGFGNQCVDVGGLSSILNIEGDSLTIPQSGSLTIVKMDDGKYYMYYKSKPGDQLVIDYQLEKYTSINTVTTNTEYVQENNSWWNKETRTFTDVFQENRELDLIFEGIEKRLSKMDPESDRGAGPYAAFMNAAFDAGIDAIVDDTDYQKAFEKLKFLLDAKLSDPIFDILKTKINDLNISTKDKLMIVDRFKAIFSYHIELTDGKNDGQNLSALINGNPPYQHRRGRIYETLKGYDGSTEFPLKGKKYRDKVLNQLKDKGGLSREPKKNLFGMTALYRLGRSEKGRSYSLTQMGSTNVLGGYMESIATQDLELTQNWFLSNLDKSGPHKQIIKNALLKQINIDGLIDFNDDQLKQVLKGDEIVLDINGKKTKIKLELEYVFYLLGECANESIGINLKGVNIKTETGEDNTTHDDYNENIKEESGGGRWVRVIDGDKTYSSGIYTESVGSNAEIDYARQNKVDVGVGYGNVPKVKPPEIVPPDPNQGTGVIPPDPNQGTGVIPPDQGT